MPRQTLIDDADLEKLRAASDEAERMRPLVNAAVAWLNAGTTMAAMREADRLGAEIIRYDRTEGESNEHT